MEELWAYILERDAFALEDIAAREGQAFGVLNRYSLDQLFGSLPLNGPFTFLDLGSGTGTVLFYVARRYGDQVTRCVGIELNPVVHNEALVRREALGMERQVDLSLGDILKIPTLAPYHNQTLVVFSFDARMPRVVMNHMYDLVNNYNGGRIIWITTHSQYYFGRNDLNLMPFHFQSTFGGERRPNGNYSIQLGMQDEDYPPDEWDEKEEANDRRNQESLRLLVQTGVMPEILESMQLFRCEKMGPEMMGRRYVQ